MKLSNVVTPGNKIDMKRLHEKHSEDNGGKLATIFHSSVCDVISDQEIAISMPTNEGKMILFPVGEVCDFVFFTKRGMYRCEGEVKSRYREGNLYMLTIVSTTDVIKFQRREFFRIDYIADMNYYEIDSDVANLSTTALLFQKIQQPNYIDEVRKGIIKDLSGGGIQFLSEIMHERGKFVLVELRLTNDRMDDTFYLVCQIISSEKHPTLNDKYNNRAKFVFKDVKDREKIVRFVFEEERRIRRKENG